MISDELKQAIAAIPEAGYSADGKPTVNALKAAWSDVFPDEPALDISAADRDEIWAAWLEQSDAGPEAAPEQPLCYRVTVTKSAANPLKLVVNGSVRAVLQVGQETIIDPVAYDHLTKVPGVEFTEG